MDSVQNPIQRPHVSMDMVDVALAQLRSEIIRRMDQHGPGTFVSTHEIVGVIEEEFNELKHEVHGNASPERLCSELMDIAVPSIFAVACFNSNTVEVRASR